MQDFKEIRREMTSFNAQMMKVLEDKDGQGFMADIQVRIRKNYGTDPNIFAGILSWRMIEGLDKMIIDELATIESNKLHNLIKDESIRKSVDMFNWLVSIHKSVAQLMQMGEDDKQIKRTSTIPKANKVGRNVEMPPGVSLTATSCQDFQNIAAGKALSKYTGQGAAFSKPKTNAYIDDKDVPFGRSAMSDHK
jgi:hypothetical protein